MKGLTGGVPAGPVTEGGVVLEGVAGDAAGFVLGVPGAGKDGGAPKPPRPLPCMAFDMRSICCRYSGFELKKRLVCTTQSTDICG